MMITYEELIELRSRCVSANGTPDELKHWVTKEMGIDGEAFQAFCGKAGEGGMIALKLFLDGELGVDGHPVDVLASIFAVGFEIGVRFSQEKLPALPIEI